MKMKMFLIALMILILPVMAFADVDIVKSKSEAGAISGSYINSYPNYLNTGNLPTYLLQIIPGVVGDVTNNEDMPVFEGMISLRTRKIIVDLRTELPIQLQDFDKFFAAGIPLAVLEPDKVIKVEAYTRGGRIFGFSRLEDFDTDLVNVKPKAMKALGLEDDSNLRIKVLFKMSTKTIGTNIAGQGQSGGFTGGTNPIAWGTGGGGVFGVAVNTADPKFILKYYKVIPGAITYFNTRK